MLFRQMFDITSCTYTYLLATGLGGEALIIDPVQPHLTHYIQLINELELTLSVVLDTHTHADHITASGKLRKEFKCDIVMGEKSKATCITGFLKDGDYLNIGHLKIKTIYTPGHTDDSYCFYMDDRVFTGDTLLIRGSGRTDFQSGNPFKAYDSIFNKLLQLPETTLVYPAHDYNGMTVSTIGEEKRYNPRLQVQSAEKYAEIMNNLNLPKPNMIEIAVPANLKCGLEN